MHVCIRVFPTRVTLDSKLSKLLLSKSSNHCDVQTTHPDYIVATLLKLKPVKMCL